MHVRLRPQPRSELTEERVARRQLEGRLESIEDACRRYRAVDRMLRVPGWRARVSARPALLEELLSAKSKIAEARDFIERRAQRESWPSAHPVLHSVKRLHDAQRRLDRAVRRRLVQLGAAELPGQAEESLRLLVTLVHEGAPAPVRSDELVLLSGERLRFPNEPRGWLWMKSLVVLALLPVLLLTLIGVGQGQWWASALLLGLFGAPLVLAARSGRYTLTRERLIWQPELGQPVQVRLSSIRTESVRLKRWSHTVELTGTRRLRLGTVTQAEQLADMVRFLHHLHPLVPTRGLSTTEVALCPGWMESTGETSVKGTLILRPRSVAFLPEGSAAALVQALAPDMGSVQLTEEQLVRALTALREHEFDRQVARAVEQAGGQLWSARGTRLVGGAWKGVAFAQGERRLLARGDVEQFEPLRRLFARHWAS